MQNFMFQLLLYNAQLSKLLDEGFGRSIYWNKYKVVKSSKVVNNRVAKIADDNEEK